MQLTKIEKMGSDPVYCNTLKYCTHGPTSLLICFAITREICIT